MGFSVMLWDAEKLVPAEYWCPYGTWDLEMYLMSHTLSTQLGGGGGCSPLSTHSGTCQNKLHVK